MSNTTISPYMNLLLPIPGLETGPQYAIDNNTAFSLVDQHTHIPGQGLPVPTAGLNINADLSFASYNAINLRSTRYTNYGAPLNLVTDLNCISVVNGDMYFNDGVGNKIQMTLAGSVNTSSSGNISGMGATTASVVYTSIDHTFSFYSNTATPAPLYIGPVTIGLNSASPVQKVTITPSISQTVPYTITLPPALPVSTQQFVTIDQTGQQAIVPPDNKTVAIVGGQLTAFLPPGMIMAYGAGNVPTGWLVCDGSIVSRTTYAALYANIGDGYGSGNGTTTFQLPDFRGQFLRGVSGTSGSDPDASSRIASGAGGNVGNNVGSGQDNIFTSHTHTVTDPGHNHTQNSHNHTQDAHTHTQASHSHFVSSPIAPTNGDLSSTNHPVYNITANTNGTGGTTGYIYGTTATPDRGLTGTAQPTIDATTATNQAATATNNSNTTGISNTSTGGAETRPSNIYVNFLIKT